jgi:hypothetical protein
MRPVVYEKKRLFTNIGVFHKRKGRAARQGKRAARSVGRYRETGRLFCLIETQGGPQTEALGEGQCFLGCFFFFALPHLTAILCVKSLVLLF